MQPVTFAPSAAAIPPEAVAPVDTPDAAPLHTASLQAAARPQAVVAAEAPRPPDPTQPVAELSNGFALPADQLMPVTLIGLQVHPGDAWPMTRQAEVPGRRGDGDAGHDEDGRSEPRRAPPARDDAVAGDEADDGLADDPAAVVEVQVDAPADWHDALARAINERLAAPQPPAALRSAAEQWSRARCVVLVCPRSDAGEAAWAFVLWPRRTARPRGPLALRFSFTGQRFDARLQWSGSIPAPAWCEVRTIKEHHPRGGRRLVALDAGGTPLAAVPCELQLGPVRFAPPRWRVAGVRIDAVHRFWTALGGQWSVLLLVSPQPLLADQRTPPTIVEAA